MAHKKNNGEKKPENPKSFLAFLKKRAPIYLGILGLFIVFAYPALTEKNLESLLPNSFEGEEKIAIELIKSYQGTNQRGMTILQVIEEIIVNKYPDEKIFDNEDTLADLIVSNLNDREAEFTHEDIFHFKAHDEMMAYSWYVNIDTSEISPIDIDTRKVMQTVDYYD